MHETVVDIVLNLFLLFVTSIHCLQSTPDGIGAVCCDRANILKDFAAGQNNVEYLSYGFSCVRRVESAEL